MNVGKSASVKLFENSYREFTEPLHSLVVAERSANVGDLPATINTLRVGNEQDAGYRHNLGSDVE